MYYILSATITYYSLFFEAVDLDMFLLQQLPRSLYCFVHYCALYVMAIFVLAIADGFSWIDVPDEHINVKHGYPFRINWHYEMDENETFLSSDIESLEASKLYLPIALRHGEDNTYEKYQKDDAAFSIFGKNKVTLIVHSAEIGQKTTYCCEVKWRSVAGINKSSICSKVFVYDVPRITYHIPQLSCKQGDSIKLKCNATGIPKPHVSWLHGETHSLIDSSSDIALTITGKRSEGRYCCHANNRFGRETACTAINVTEYEPMNTTLLVNQSKRDDVNIIHIECKAVASPSSNLFIIRINDENYTSSNGVETLEVQAPRKRKINKIVVSCIPCNKYGQGPNKTKEIVFPIYDPPRFTNPIRTEYNMTASGITLKCKASGTPTPNITWTTRDTGDIVGAGEFYRLSYKNGHDCQTKTMKFMCNARNAMGNISSPEIHVKVLTTPNCSNQEDEGLDQDNTVLEKWVIMSCTFVLIIIIIIIIIVIRRRLVLWWELKTVQKDLERVIGFYEDPCQEPIDAVVQIRDGSQSLAKSDTTSTDEGYATVEECRLPRARTRQDAHILLSVKNNPHPGEEDPTYESLVPREL